jgi:DNA-binding MarR family transcriptional regulator
MPEGRQDIADELHSAALHLVRMVRTVDGEMGLSPARASALSVLVFGGPRTVGALAEAEGVRSPTMTRLVNGLESDGLVRRRAGDGDRRQVVVEATPEARRLLQAGRRRRVALLEGLLAEIGDDDLEVLRRAAVLMEAAVGMAGERMFAR